MGEVFKSQESLSQKETIKPQELPKLKSEDVLMQISRIQKDLEAKKDTYSKGFNEKELVKYKNKTQALDQKYQPKFKEFKDSIQSIQQKKIQASQDAVRVFAKQNPLEINSTIKPIEGLSKTEIGGALQYMSYKMLGIENETMNNGKVKQFLKGLVDSLLVQNGDLVNQLKDNPGLLVNIVQTILSWEGLCMIAEGLKTSVADIFTGNAYEKGKAIGDLGLVTSGVALGTKLGKWGIKETMKLGRKEMTNNITKDVVKNEVKQEIKNTLSQDIIKNTSEKVLSRTELIANIEQLALKKVVKQKLKQPEIPGATISEKIQHLYQRSEKMQPYFDQILENLGKTSDAKVIKAPPKSMNRMMEKVELEYGNNIARVEEISDAIRGTLEYNTLEELEKGLHDILKNPNFKEFRVKDNLGDMLVGDMNITFRMDNGMVGEIKLYTKEMLDAQDRGIILPKEFLEKEFLINEHTRTLQEQEMLRELNQKNALQAQKFNIQPKELHLHTDPTKPIKNHNYYEIERSIKGELKKIFEEKYTDKKVFIFTEKLKKIQKMNSEYAKTIYEKRNGSNYSPIQINGLQYK